MEAPNSMHRNDPRALLHPELKESYMVQDVFVQADVRIEFDTLVL